jgi:biotin carboxyl carrier protein
MPGAVFEIKKEPGDAVKEGETVLVLEAMKMEMAIASPADGVVAEILVSKGDQVTAGQVLATLD